MERPGPQKVEAMGLDIHGVEQVQLQQGVIAGRRGGERVVLGRFRSLEEPGWSYFVDADGDISREPAGTPWSPPAAAGPFERFEAFADDTTLAAIGFARVPVQGPGVWQSELLEPARAIAAQRAARALFPRTTLAPVVQTTRIRRHQVDAHDRRAIDLADHLAQLAAFDADTWVHAREDELVAMFGSDEAAAYTVEQFRAHELELAQLDAERLAPRPPGPFHIERGGRYVVLHLLACPPVAVPLCLGFGGWSLAPDPIVQSGMLAHWHEAYGAELVVVGDTHLELRTTRALTPRELQQLAWEQFLFAPASVLQGAGSPSALAQSLTTGHWFLWWD